MGQLVTFTVQDTTPAPVAGVLVEVQDASQRLVASGTTDPSGVLSLTLDPGAYGALARLPGYFDATPVTVTVVAAPVAVPITMTPVGITKPTTPATCVLYGFLEKIGPETLPEWVHITESVNGQYATLLSNAVGPVNPENQSFAATSRQVPIRNNYWQATVFQGSAVRVFIPELGFEKVFLVPMGKQTLSIADTRSVLGSTLIGLAGDTATTSSISGRH